jgi:hypothetical protein
MATKRIFTIGFALPGEEFEFVQFDSDQSLLDADIILFEPGFGAAHPSEDYEGIPLFSKYESPCVAQSLTHWRSELVSAVNAGKLVIVYLAKPLRYYRYTGDKTFSGSGRSRVTTNVVEEVRSYAAIPNVTSVEAKSGREVRLTKDGVYLAPYWKEFASHSPYEAFVEGKFTHSVLTTKSGEKIVAAAFRGRGWLLFLPPLRYDEKTFIKYDAKRKQGVWTAEAIKFGKRLTGTIVALADALTAGRSRTPSPEWARASMYATVEESDLQGTIEQVSKQIARLQQTRTDLQQKLLAAGGLRGLLYEQGKPLEYAVREALTLFGFEAKSFRQADSEFDVVFESPEGRFIGEVEGKDNRAINIDKLSQLERNIQEDFARDEVTDYAKGVLFGNAERLAEPSKRGRTFTEKCLTGAQRAGIALVRTADLFEPARYLRGHADTDYARACRQAIFAASGKEAEFAPPPVAGTTELTATRAPEHQSPIDATAAPDASNDAPGSAQQARGAATR